MADKRFNRGFWGLTGLLVWVAALGCRPAGGQDSGKPPAAEPLSYMIIVTGGELLSGAYPDAHTLFLTRTLRPLGLRCVGSMIVDDKQADIREALRFATARAELVIVTGGLGPTTNDVTREALAEFTGIPLAEDPAALEQMERRFKQPRDQLRPNLRRQTQVPTRGGYLKNPHGTAVGLVFEWDPAVIVALPGPPRELQPMVRDELVPYLNRRFGTRLPGCSLTLRFVGLGQSQIDQTLKQHVPIPEDVTVFSHFEGVRVDFTFSLAHDTAADRGRLEGLKQQILKHLGEYVYGDGDTTLEQHVARLLSGRGQTLVLAEVGSGGVLAAGLTGPDAAGVLAGAYVAPSEPALRRLLRVPEEKWPATGSSAERTGALATAAAERSASHWAIAVGQVQQDLGGGQSVEIVFRRPDGRLEHRTLGLRGGDQTARANLATQVLDQLRRRLK